MAAPSDNTYNAAHLLVLEGLDAVRKRPGMYIGSTDTRGLMHCLWEIIDNGVDEALAGSAKRVEVTLHPDDSVERELMIMTVRAEGGMRGQDIELVQVFQGRIVDVGHGDLTVELAGPPSKLDDFEDLMRAYGIAELQRTGRIALPKLERQVPRLRSLGRVG